MSREFILELLNKQKFLKSHPIIRKTELSKFLQFLKYTDSLKLQFKNSSLLVIFTCEKSVLLNVLFLNTEYLLASP